MAHVEGFLSENNAKILRRSFLIGPSKWSRLPVNHQESKKLSRNGFLNIFQVTRSKKYLPQDFYHLLKLKNCQKKREKLKITTFNSSPRTATWGPKLLLHILLVTTDILDTMEPSHSSCSIIKFPSKKCSPSAKPAPARLVLSPRPRNPPSLSLHAPCALINRARSRFLPETTGPCLADACCSNA